jgi:hypothetical protein
MTAEKFPVDLGLIRTFAQALGEKNPVYYEETAESTSVGHVIAPPTFLATAAHWDPDYPLRWNPDKPWNGSGATEGTKPAGTGGGTGLHAEQHYTYHRALRPGDVLTAAPGEGKTWEREGRRGGTMSFSESVTEWRDESGELVVTARSVGVRTGKVVTSEGSA